MIWEIKVSRETRSSPRKKWFMMMALGFTLSALLSLIGGAYLIAFTSVCFAIFSVLISAGAEEKGGILNMLLWAFLAGAVVASLFSLVRLFL